MKGMDLFRLLLNMAFRSLFSHKAKNLIVGSIMLFGTVLVVVGTALLDSIEASMERSVVSSMAGHLQVYRADAKDDLALFGNMGMGNSDIGEVEAFDKLREVAESVENVKTVVPMGINVASIYTGNELDQVLQELRDAIEKDAKEQQALCAGQVRQFLEQMISEYETRLSVIKDQDSTRAELDTLRKAAAEDFWKDFESDPVTGLDFLDANVAKLADEGQLIYLRYLGTDVDLFQKSFSTFQLVDGEMTPSGQRGLMLSKTFYEERVKNRVARLLDKINEGVAKRDLSIAGDGELGLWARQLPGQYGRITLQLKPRGATELEASLRTMMPEEKGDLKALVQAFLDVDDSNFKARYQFFYDEIAPKIRLYRVNIGDTLTLRSYTKSGYAKAANIKIYGTFSFAGLEESDLAGAANLIDMVTFRELYGHMSAEQKAELATIREGVQAERAAREDAEAALFGGDGELEEEDAGAGFDEFEGGDLKEAKAVRETMGDGFTQEEIDTGLVLNAAIILKDAGNIEESQKELEAAFASAGLNMKVVDWQKASGVVGQFITVVRLVLYIAIFIIFLVALVIINNSMVIATMERVSEIGTMRALGVQKPFVTAMLLLETLMLGAFAGGAALLGSFGVMALLGTYGIPAGHRVMVFLFSGPRLYPELGLGHLLFGFGVILVVSIASTLYPARLAMAIQPVVAMQARE